MDKPIRSVDAETVRGLLSYTGLPEVPDRLETQLEGVRLFLDVIRDWEPLHLGHRFEDGQFGNVPMIAQHIPAWQTPTGLNKRRVVEGDVVLEADGGEQP